MKNISLFLCLILFSCVGKQSPSDSNSSKLNQYNLKNEKVRNYKMLDGMYSDEFFPKSSVDKVKEVLVGFCFDIENQKPKTPDQLYNLSHKAIAKINALQADFERNESEIETGGREVIAGDFIYISNAYGFEADIEELISNRDW